MEQGSTVVEQFMLDGLNGVNRQPSNSQKSNRQPSKMENFRR